MSILAKKLKLIEWLLKIQDETILNKIEIWKEHNIDKWDELTEEQKAEIDEALAELDAGKGIPHEKVMAKLKHRWEK